MNCQIYPPFCKFEWFYLSHTSFLCLKCVINSTLFWVAMRWSESGICFRDALSVCFLFFFWIVFIIIIIRPQLMCRYRNSGSLVRISLNLAIFVKYKIWFFFLPAAISLQSSVGRHLMNYLLSEVMFTSLYIYWDSPPPRFFFFFCFFPVASIFFSLFAWENQILTASLKRVVVLF